MAERSRRWYLAVCGLDCSGCPALRRTGEGPDCRKSEAVDRGMIRCDGCRSERKAETHCSSDCKLVACCADIKGLEFCAQCGELDSCDLVREFEQDQAYEHHRAAVDRLREMRRVGIETWLVEHGFGK